MVLDDKSVQVVTDGGGGTLPSARQRSEAFARDGGIMKASRIVECNILQIRRPPPLLRPNYIKSSWSSQAHSSVNIAETEFTISVISPAAIVPAPHAVTQRISGKGRLGRFETIQFPR